MKKILLTFALFACFIGNVMADTTDDAVSAKVSGTTLNIGLTNAKTYCAFQMDITLPSGVSASAIKAVSTRLSQDGSDTEVGGTKFIVAYNQIDADKNVWRVIAYNLANEQITGVTGDILNITLSETVSNPTAVSVANILFVDKTSLAGVDLGTAIGEQGVLLGDVNKDKEVDTADIVALLDIIFYDPDGSKNKYPEYDYVAANVNNDNSIDTADIVSVLNIIFKVK